MQFTANLLSRDVFRRHVVNGFGEFLHVLFKVVRELGRKAILRAEIACRQLLSQASCDVLQGRGQRGQ